MELVGTVMVSRNFVPMVGFENYQEIVRKDKMLSVVEINDGIYHCLTREGLVDIEKKFVLLHVPFIKEDGMLVPTTISRKEKIENKIRMVADGLDSDPFQQILWLFQKYPEMILDDKDFYPNGIWALRLEFDLN